MERRRAVRDNTAASADRRPESTMRARPILLAAVTCSFLLLIVDFHLASARAGYSHYRNQHIGTALEYAAGKIDLLRPVIVGFTVTGTADPAGSSDLAGHGTSGVQAVGTLVWVGEFAFTRFFRHGPVATLCAHATLPRRTRGLVGPDFLSGPADHHSGQRAGLDGRLVCSFGDLDFLRIASCARNGWHGSHRPLFLGRWRTWRGPISFSPVPWRLGVSAFPCLLPVLG